MSAAASSIREAMTVPKALSLITGKHSSEMVERHVRALNRIASSFKSGVVSFLQYTLRTLADTSKGKGYSLTHPFSSSPFSSSLLSATERSATAVPTAASGC
jgi:hypothetical protein